MVELVKAQVVRPLRRAVLRPDQPADRSTYPADDDPRSAHAAVRRAPHAGAVHGDGPNTEVVAVGSVLLDPPPWEPERVDGWRVRGMATRPMRAETGWADWSSVPFSTTWPRGEDLWCGATPASGHRASTPRAGFRSRGEVFDIPGIGPHIQMWRELTDPRSLTDGSGTGETPGSLPVASRRLGRPGPPVPT